MGCGHVTKITFRKPRHLREWNRCETLLQSILLWVAETEWPCTHGSPPLEISSIYRTEDENRRAGAKTAIHCQTPHRALDVAGTSLPQIELDTISDAVNARWTYDPSRPWLPVAYSAKHGTGPHIHLQVSSATRLVVRDK
jgi:hypothetical protein